MTDLTKFRPQESETVKQIYAWHEEKQAKSTRVSLGRLGASRIGLPCERSLWYEFRKLVKPVFKGRMLRLFQTGHLEEPRMVEELRGIGCTVHAIDEATGDQIEFTALGGHFVDYLDAAILGIPEAPKTWHVGEFKTFGGTETQLSKDFEQVKKKGVKLAKPEHYAQMMCGMGLSGMTRAFYLGKKKATDELHSERIRYNAKEYVNLLGKAERIIRSVAPPERSATRMDSFTCKFCDAKALCWGTSDVAVPIVSKTCRSCCHSTPELDDTSIKARWSCSHHECNIDSLDQDCACPFHLLLPGLIMFANPVDTGDGWIEFENIKDKARWRHGNEKGMWSTDELLRTPAGPLLADRGVEKVKKAFDGEVESVETFKFEERYNPEVAQIICQGDDSTANILKGLEDLGIVADEVSTDGFSDDVHTAVEYRNQYCLVIYKEYNHFVIWHNEVPF